MGLKNNSRRNFIKTTALVTFGTVLAPNAIACAIENKGSISMLLLPEDSIASSKPAVWAVEELRTALQNQGVNIQMVNKLEDADDFCIVVSGTGTKIARTIFNQQNITVPNEPESLGLVQTVMDNRTVLLASGTDARGLVYALTELADRVKCLETDRAALEFSSTVLEKPASKTRSVLRNFSSEVEDKVWFYDKEYWTDYLDTLAYSRINRLNFSMGMAYNSVQNVKDGYLVFPYPFFVKVPGYEVSASGLSDEEQSRNLEILKFVGKESTKRGVQLQLGIWTLAYDWDRSPNPDKRSPDATYKIKGLTDAVHADYCRDALALILQEVPEISGLTFRVHEESGIALGQKSFWKTQFSAVADCGRTVEIDMHSKNMEEETLYDALATGQPVVVSPKFCGEHLGLPYHQASIREFEMLEVDGLVDKGKGLLEGNRKFTRYGYADMLSENRTWDVLYRIWPGTQRFLLSGDPQLFAGYGRTANFCGALGFEVCEPLHFKGRRGTGVAGGRCGYLDTTLKPRFDFEKYGYFYRLWGRLLYNPDTDPEIWRRALTREFGTAAMPIEIALAQTTRILPLFYLAHGVSANCMVYLPELYQNSYMAKETDWPYDTEEPKTFGSISPMDPQLFLSPDEFGENLIYNKNTGKYNPIEVAQWLEEMARKASANIEKARSVLDANASKPNFRRIEEDVLILIEMAQFFAAKMRSAVIWKIFMVSGDRKAGEKSVALYQNGRNSWANMAERAKTVYKTDLSYGPSGHWIDRIPSFDEDIADMKTRIENPKFTNTNLEASVVDRAVQRATSKLERQTVEVGHVPQKSFRRGTPLSISLESPKRPQRVSLYYRHINQSEYWQSIALKQDGNTYTGEIPKEFTDERFPLQYYFEIATSPSKATLFPSLANNLANVPYFVVYQKHSIQSKEP